MRKSFVAFLVIASLLFAPSAQAIEIRQFDRIAGDDQIDYITQLVNSVEAATSGQQLAQVKRFFMNKQPGEQISGMGQFEVNLALARIADIDNAEKDLKARRLEVEDVLYVTMEKNGIVLPAGFRPSAPNFKPKLPLSPKFMTREDAVKAQAEMQAWAARGVAPDVPHEFRQGTLSGFSDNEKAIAFFAALAAVVVVASNIGNGKGSSSVAPSGGTTGGGTTAGGGTKTDTRPWWEQQGFKSFADAMHAACMKSQAGNAHPNC
jgi:hypothetical protein